MFVMANGVAVVDTKNPGWGQPILAKIKELTPKPVTLIVNTHTHGDHVSGNVDFPATVDVVVHDNTAANMKKLTGRGSTPEKPVPSIFEQNQGRGLPKRTFKDRMTIGSGADQIDLHYFGRGHTNGDAWVLFPALRIVHAGDIFAGQERCRFSTPTTAAAGSRFGTPWPRRTARSARAPTPSSPGTACRLTMNESAGILAVQPRLPRSGLNRRRRPGGRPRSPPRPGRCPGELARHTAAPGGPGCRRTSR